MVFIKSKFVSTIRFKWILKYYFQRGFLEFQSQLESLAVKADEVTWVKVISLELLLLDVYQ
jgi:hypothetical protein